MLLQWQGLVLLVLRESLLSLSAQGHLQPRAQPDACPVAGAEVGAQPRAVHLCRYANGAAISGCEQQEGSNGDLLDNRRGPAS